MEWNGRFGMRNTTGSLLLALVTTFGTPTVATAGDETLDPEGQLDSSTGIEVAAWGHIVAPTPIASMGTLNDVRNAIVSHGLDSGAQFTNPGGAIEHTLGLFTGLGMSVGIGHVNVGADGSPIADMQDSPDAKPSDADAETYAHEARDLAIAAAWDDFSAEVIQGSGEAGFTLGFLRAFVYPQPYFMKPPFPELPGSGFVIHVGGVDGHASAPDPGLRVSSERTPEGMPKPAGLALSAIGLFGLAALARRRWTA